MNLSKIWSILRETYAAIMADRVSRLGAALAFYMTFSLAPLLLVVVAIAGLVFGRQAAQGQLFIEMQSVIGHDLAVTVQSLIASAEHQGSGALAGVIATITVLAGALGVFFELQDMLNMVLGTRDQPDRALRGFLQRRLLAFLLVVAFGILLLASVALSTVVTIVNGVLDRHNSAIRVPDVLMSYFPTVVSFVSVTLVFALIYRFLPDIRIAWKSVWIGSLTSSVLFSVGKSLLGLYLGYFATTSVYGAAASLIALMLWNYYTAQVILVGAELMKVHARHQMPSTPV